ncbi:MAG: amino acid ABC transporter substrate-binding protein [Devosia sp.]|nr:amino acid ABC transporter substrate-binding protein [Devosia sp.]
MVAYRKIDRMPGRYLASCIRAAWLLPWLVAAAAWAFATAADASTLDIVRARGKLLCGSADPLPGFAQQNSDGRWSGFDVDFCRAVAAAVFGDPNKVEFRPMTGSSRFALLQTGTVDLLARDAAWTMRRDSGYGASYVGASFFDGQGFLVHQSLNVVSAYELNKLRVCVLDGGDEVLNVRDFFFQNQAAYTEVLYEDREDLTVAYQAGLCDAVSANVSWLYAMKRALPDPSMHLILPERISKDSFGPVVRDGDDQWFNIVKWTLFTLIDAEEVGITADNIGSLAAAKTPAIRRMLGLEGTFGAGMGLGPDFMKSIIGAVGNYGEIFDRNFGPNTGVPLLRGQNALWTRGGLLFAPPVE